MREFDQFLRALARERAGVGAGVGFSGAAPLLRAPWSLRRPPNNKWPPKRQDGGSP